MENEELLFHRNKDNVILLDKRLEFELMMRDKKIKCNVLSYRELVLMREQLILKEKLGDDISKFKFILELVELKNITKEQKSEAEKYESFDHYLSVNNLKTW